ncbi:hypothetical protein N7540_004216 [Penicillium herquei]|nr:hypothetical protein N7540_004216 [Penicillium herquei]
MLNPLHVRDLSRILNPLHGVDFGLLVLCRCRLHGVDIHFIGACLRNLSAIDQWDWGSNSLVLAADPTGNSVFNQAVKGLVNPAESIRKGGGDSFVELLLAQFSEIHQLVLVSLRNVLGNVQLAGNISLAANFGLAASSNQLGVCITQVNLQLPISCVERCILGANIVEGGPVTVQLTFQIEYSGGQELLVGQVRRCRVGQGFFLLAALIKRVCRSGRGLRTASAYVADAQDGSDQQRTHRNQNAAENHLVHGDK